MEQQHSLLLRSVAISSGLNLGQTVTPQDRATAYTTLEQFHKYEGRVPTCIALLSQERHYVPSEGIGAPVDATVPAKLYALSVLQSFLRKGYVGLSEQDRLALRNSVLTSARQLAALPTESPAVESEGRILGMKIASLLSDLAVRDFPQRWAGFVGEVFAPVSGGGIWCEAGGGGMESGSSMLGVKVGLECLKLITEDCTDSDFNAKISTSRRNDILIGLNEVSSQILPLIFQLLSSQYSVVTSAKSTLHEMAGYLLQNNRTPAQMTPEEQALWTVQINRRDMAGRLVGDCLGTIEKFCASMPLDWILDTKNGCDFVGAMLHLLREETSELQVSAVACLEQLAIRKLEFKDWASLVERLPGAVNDANAAAATLGAEKAAIARASGGGDGSDQLTDQLPFHRALSKMLAHLVSAHISHVTTDKDIVKGRGPKFQSLSTYLRLLADMLSHPSGRICSEQINTWIALLRDPQIVQTKILSPYMQQVLSSYMGHMVRVRWDDVDEGVHPFAKLFDASWDDKDEYNAWLCDLRSKASQLFKFISNTEPKMSASVMHSKIRTAMNAHGNGQPLDHVDPKTNQLTQTSEANMQFEALHQPLDNILQGLPPWSMQGDGSMTNGSFTDPKRAEIRASVRASLAEVANIIVSWNPTFVWLKFRRVTLLDALKYFWKYDPTTLPTGVDALLVYLNAEDDGLPVSSALAEGNRGLSPETVSLRKKSGVSLVSVSKRVPHHLAPWLSQLSDRAKTLLSSDNLLPPNRMHLYEFLSCAATAVEDPVSRATFISDVLSNALETLDSPEVKAALASTEGLMVALGITQASSNPASVTDPMTVKSVTGTYVQLFSAINQIFSVGKRCHEAAKKRPNGGIPLQNIPASSAALQQHFPDEGLVSLNDLAVNDPFVPLWPKVLPALIQVVDVTLRLWHPEYQAVLLLNAIQRYAYAISDDEAYLATKQDSKAGGVFGEGGTAGSIVSGWDRRDMNLAPKWSGWFNELRNTCFQMLGLCSAQRVLFAPELAGLFPTFVEKIVNAEHLRAMEHRHFTQYMKQFIEILLLSCPATLYRSHLSPILGPVFEHLQYRMKCTWSPIIETQPSSTGRTPSGSGSVKALTNTDCVAASSLAAQGGEAWFAAYYARAGLFVGDLDSVTAESVVEKSRVELCRTYSDVIQAGLALKGEWALVLANQAKEEQAARKNDPSKLSTGPKTRVGGDGLIVNADGTPRGENQIAIEARKSLRIHSLCHFLLLEDERVAGFLTMGAIQCLGYPDAYTVRRCTRICHRILETVAWSSHYTPLLGNQMFSTAVTNIVTEPKWMVGIEWDMINLIRDIYCRLVLGQTLLPGGQGPGVQQPRDPGNPLAFEQSRNVDKPLLGGGVLASPSDLPRQMLALIPGIGMDDVINLDKSMTEKRSAKDQKDILRDLLRVAAENTKESDNGVGGVASGIFGRAIAEESLLNQNIRGKAVPDLPEKLVTHSMIKKKEAGNDQPANYGGLSLFKTWG